MKIPQRADAAGDVRRHGDRIGGAYGWTGQQERRDAGGGDVGREKQGDGPAGARQPVGDDVAVRGDNHRSGRARGEIGHRHGPGVVEQQVAGGRQRRRGNDIVVADQIDLRRRRHRRCRAGEQVGDDISIRLGDPGQTLQGHRAAAEHAHRRRIAEAQQAAGHQGQPGGIHQVEDSRSTPAMMVPSTATPLLSLTKKLPAVVNAPSAAMTLPGLLNFTVVRPVVGPLSRLAPMTPLVPSIVPMADSTTYRR